MKSFFEDLWTQSWFACGVRDKWSALVEAGILNTLKDKATTISALLSESQPKNAEKWTNSLKTKYNTYSTYSAAVAAISTYLDQRVPYLTAKFSALTTSMCEHTLAYSDNGNGTHKYACSKCGYEQIAADAHTLAVDANGKAKCSVCATEISTALAGTPSEGEKVYILNAGTSNAQYITKTGGFTPTANTVYKINEQPAEGTSFNNVYWVGEDGNNYADNIVVTDGTAWTGDVKIYAKSAEYSRTMKTDAVWGTVCLPFKTQSNDDVKLYELSESTTDANGSTMVFTEATSTGGLTPLVFKKNGEKTTKVEFAFSAQETGYVTVKDKKDMSFEKTGTSTATNWQFIGNVKKTKTLTIANTDALYFISSNQFHRAKGTLNVTPFRAYFVNTAPANSEVQAAKYSILADDDSSTAIDNVQVSATRPLAIFTKAGGISIVAPSDMHVTIYNINGMEVESINALKDKEYDINLPQGLYIINGLKFRIN